MNQLGQEMLGNGNANVRPGTSCDPVFVLCAARSGSTLLRFMLDAHPDLACPPETNLPGLCALLATVWSLIEGAPLAAERGTEPPRIPDAAIAGVRHTVDLMVASYLARRGKKRYCDKSLGAARHAELLRRVYPGARFLCLHRHPMDVIASGLEACPWGLSGYGFEPYIASSPGNAVLALASFWADSAAEILAAEERFPDACHRIRYEDMVCDPEGIADGIFRFLGVPPVPGISSRCFDPDRERSGPADYKIWHTSQVTADSVGRGWSIPAGMIAPQVLAQMSGLTQKLQYVPVDETWGTAGVPADLRAQAARVTLAPSGVLPASGRPDGGGQFAFAAELIGARLTAGLAGIDQRFTRRWERCLTRWFGLIVIPPVGVRGALRWRVDLAARSVMPVNDGEDDTEWDVIGSSEAWQRVLCGEVNLSVALRRCELRYCDTGDAGPAAADARIGMFANLLGVASWQSAREASASQPQMMVAAVP
jgi:Sulfotransferase family